MDSHWLFPTSTIPIDQHQQLQLQTPLEGKIRFVMLEGGTRKARFPLFANESTDCEAHETLEVSGDS